jgi:hypothetical protein
MTFDAATEPEPHVALSLDVQRALEVLDDLRIPTRP